MLMVKSVVRVIEEQRGGIGRPGDTQKKEKVHGKTPCITWLCFSVKPDRHVTRDGVVCPFMPTLDAVEPREFL